MVAYQFVAYGADTVNADDCLGVDVLHCHAQGSPTLSLPQREGSFSLSLGEGWREAYLVSSVGRDGYVLEAVAFGGPHLEDEVVAAADVVRAGVGACHDALYLWQRYAAVYDGYHKVEHDVNGIAADCAASAQYFHVVVTAFAYRDVVGRGACDWCCGAAVAEVPLIPQVSACGFDAEGCGGGAEREVIGKVGHNDGCRDYFHNSRVACGRRAVVGCHTDGVRAVGGGGLCV